jgi:hypothetical protein
MIDPHWKVAASTSRSVRVDLCARGFRSSIPGAHARAQPFLDLKRKTVKNEGKRKPNVLRLP